MRFVGEQLAIVIAETVAIAKDGAELVASRLRSAARGDRTRVAAHRPDAPRVWEEAGSNVCLDADSGDRRGDRGGVRARRPRRALRDQDQSRHRRHDGAARRGLRITTPATQHYTLYAGSGGAVRLKDDLATVLDVPAEQVRVVMRDVGGNFGTRGMIYPEFCAGRPGRRAGSAGRSSGRASGSEAFLSDYQARDLAVEAELALDARRHISSPCAAPTSATPARTRPTSRRLQKGIEIMSSIYRVPCACFPRPRGAEQHRADAPLSQRRPAGSDVRDGAADRPGRARMRLRPHRAAPPQPASREAEMPYTNPFGMVYDSGDYHGAMEQGARARRLDGFPGAARRSARSAASAAASASPTTSTRRPACRASAPRSPCMPKAASTSSSAPSRTARATRRASRSS